MNNLDAVAKVRTQRRVAVVAIFIGLFACAVVVRAFKLQVLDGGALKEMAQHQHLRAIKVSPRRGTIYDRNGTELAISVDVDSVLLIQSSCARTARIPIASPTS
ncbi:MAG: hypothetical protein R3A47_08795 [Polyangiales bacterium]